MRVAVLESDLVSVNLAKEEAAVASGRQHYDALDDLEEAKAQLEKAQK